MWSTTFGTNYIKNIENFIGSNSKYGQFYVKGVLKSFDSFQSANFKPFQLDQITTLLKNSLPKFFDGVISSLDYLFDTGVIRFNERNDRERISNGGQVLRDDREGSGTGSWKTFNVNSSSESKKKSLNFQNEQKNMSVKMVQLP